MKHSLIRIIIASLAAVALVAALVGSAVASKPAGAGDTGKGHHGIKLGVTKPTGGTTVLTVDPAYGAALTAAGVTVTPFGTATAGTGTFSFPITGGKIVYKKAKHNGKAHKKALAGSILHVGSGLTLAKTGGASATVSDFRVNLAAGRSGRIDVTLGTGKLKLATLSNVVVNATDKSVSATVTLTADAVAAVNAAYGTTFPASGALLGTVVIRPTF